MEPKIETYQKVYTMGPGIDFPLVMNYTDTDTGNGQSYFYFLSGHNDVVFFADYNFTEDQVESYEYNPWGFLLTSANNNNLLYTAREFDFDTRQIYYRNFYYDVLLAQFIGFNLKYFRNSTEVYAYFSQYNIDNTKEKKIFPLNKGIIVKDKTSHDDYIASVDCCAGGCNTQSRCERCGGRWSVLCYGAIFLWDVEMWCEA